MSEDALCYSYTLIGWEQISRLGPFSLFKALLYHLQASSVVSENSKTF